MATFSFEEAQFTKPEPAPAKSRYFSFEEAQFTKPPAATSAALPSAAPYQKPSVNFEKQFGFDDLSKKPELFEVIKVCYFKW